MKPLSLSISETDQILPVAVLPPLLTKGDAITEFYDPFPLEDFRSQLKVGKEGQSNSGDSAMSG